MNENINAAPSAPAAPAAAVVTVDTTWPEAWHALRDDVLSGVDGLDNDQVNIVLGMLDNYAPEAAPQQHAQATGPEGSRYIAEPDEFQTKLLHAMYRAAQRGESIERMHFDVCAVIEACKLPGSRVTGNAQAALSDDQIEAAFKSSGGRWTGDYWQMEDADLHPFARAILAASQQPAAAPMMSGAMKAMTEAGFDVRVDAAAPATHPQEAETSALEQKLTERVSWTVRQWLEHVGAWENDKGEITFGSIMAVRAMMIQFQSVTQFAFEKRIALAPSPALPATRADAAPVEAKPVEGLLAALKDISEACNCCGDRADLAEIAKDALDAYAAQPSPAQGDAPPLPETRYNGCGDGSEPLYTPEMMRDFYQQGRAAGIEEAAKAAATKYSGNGGPPDDPHPDSVIHNGAVHDCVTAIRALAAKPAET